ncbi:PREDICTED: presenilin-1-like isoform X2 [Amphimedon queenslandica]|uniref:Presenilin n=1 Tax=Amphimedon queenslandica TaxID=400682 RepID=A0AAN0IYK0_AMPQE|nr:PREDICTED: presenilin-1-like isoform X2 [Amphimedon queenslandica]|eukprot:XP_019849528.1 PREDICTED: presenilin-1-like isoform X2 [Amphimedon queenslandica]
MSTNSETASLLSGEARETEYGSDNDGTREEEEETEQKDDEQSCGMKYVFKKILNVLPSFGDDGDDPTSEANEEALRFGAQQMILLIFPVFICMALVVAIQLSVEKNVTSSGTLIYTPFDEDTASNDGFVLLFALANVAIVITLVVVMTIILVCLYKYRCYKIIYGWLVVASALLLFVFSSFFFVEVLQVHYLFIDWPSFLVLIWNFGGMGVLVIHWKGPLRLQQAYLIFCSALTANIFVKYLPNWTAWILLAAISLYDLIAVLCPKGPLRVLVETARERNETIFPSLIYSTTMVWLVGMADRPTNKKKDKKNTDDTSGSSDGSHEEEEEEEGGGEREGRRDNDDGDDDTDGIEMRSIRAAADTNRERRRERQQQQQQEEEEEEEEQEERQGFKLGLGDFIFYSILVGKAAHDSTGDWVVISSCFVAILIGLCMTIIILGIVRRALPALPISIFCGLIFYFSSQYVIAPFAQVLATTQTFI